MAGETAGTKVPGYNISLSIGGKTIVGRTQDDLSITAKTKDSITKDDAGNSNESVVGHEVTFKVSALLCVGDTYSTKMDRDDLIALALATGSNAVVAVVYACTSGASYGGNAIVTDYSESSNSEDIANITLTLKVIGAFTATV